ncbi:MAG TPA: hypothetical protein PK114_02335 [Smithellaceae bacterium]|nr:hypothetical protein [Smithellaceae bacterium]
MLKVIADKTAIKKYARQFIRKFKPFTDTQVKVKLGHQGASFPAKVSYSKDLGIWMFAHTVRDVRYWNAFGIGKPQPGALLSITSEINFPWMGIDRKTGAAFAEDAWSNVFVIHRGKIGGGKKGIGKYLFEKNYRGVWSFMEDGDCVSRVAVIGTLQSPRLALQTAHFVRKIETLKSAAALSPQTAFNFPEITFREDLIGSLPSAEEQDIAARCDHDLVVGNLAALLQRARLKTGNDHNREIFLTDQFKNKISHVFAVPADNKENTILAAAAKLLLQTTDPAADSLPVLVLPEDKINLYAPLLQKIGITVIGYRMEEDRIIFSDLGKIKPGLNMQL